MTTTSTIALAELAEKGADVDMLRQMVQFMAQRLMEIDVEGRCGAGLNEKSAERINSRNGYRDRTWETRAGTVELKIPKLRQGSSCGARTSVGSTTASPTCKWTTAHLGRLRNTIPVRPSGWRLLGSHDESDRHVLDILGSCAGFGHDLPLTNDWFRYSQPQHLNRQSGLGFAHSRPVRPASLTSCSISGLSFQSFGLPSLSKSSSSMFS